MVRATVPTLLAILAGFPASAATSPGRDALRADVEGYAAAACLTRQEQPFLREQGHLWATGILERTGGSLDGWRVLGDAVAAEAARRPTPVARGTGR